MPRRRPALPRLVPVVLGCLAAALALSAQLRPAPDSALARQQTPVALGPALAESTEPEQVLPTMTSRSQPPGLPVVPLLTATPSRTPTPVNIGNFVWDDLDKDGRQDAGEPGLEGVTVQLWNPTKNQLFDSDLTDANGRYTLVAPRPDSYRIRVLLPGFLDQFSPKDQASGDDQDDSDINPSGDDRGYTDSFTIASNVISTTVWDAGIIKFRLPTPTRTPTPINIGNFVWVDLNANGVQDAGEPGLGNVAVQLWNSERTDLIDEAVTGPNGIYSVVAPVPGSYRIRVLLPTGASFAPRNQGADDLKDSDINTVLISSLYGFSDEITLASNVISTTTWDAGLINVPPTPTGTPPTLTPSMTRTPTSTPTSTATPLPGTPPAELDRRLFLPLLRG